MRALRWLLAVLTLGRLARRRAQPESEKERIVPKGTPERGAENLVLLFFMLTMIFAAGFLFVYAYFNASSMPNELLGICIGGAMACLGGAFLVIGKRLVVTEELDEDYPGENPEEQEEVVQIIHESGSRITRKRLLIGAGTAAAGALGAASLAPAVSLGPIWDTGALDRSPWRRGRRVVDETEAPIRAADVLEFTFYTGFPEGAPKEDIASSLVIIRVNPAKLKLPPVRAAWAPHGILAFSKICTHAGCAIGLYRKPTFTPVEPNDALVCPCHYSTFDPYTGGTVIYGPAGRPLPQLPLEIDSDGNLRAAGNFSARVGPGWWNVRSKPTFGTD
ncbi:MAG: ubiquinol-cytochrome c reductase iron-sulfur subunit [Solirubrobacterales bacterium]|nr:ubiquinol-cytochrome c reductase iron-sulfur subunit [Solirubrobacterales bacterium]MBV9535405.1 ubiquinol-cytochrome c reductase iron-sulfur subunit [Solirubrobacterales bacterium]